MSEAADWDDTPEEPDWLAQERSEAARHAHDAEWLEPPSTDTPEAAKPAPAKRPKLEAVPTITAAQDTVLSALADGHRATDAGNSARLSGLAEGKIRYVHAWGKWIVYRDGRWRIDNTDALITEIAKAVPRHMFSQSIDLAGDAREHMFKWANRSESASAVASMIRLARGIPGVIVDHRDLDSHPWLLNVANGTIDLRTGELGPHDPDHLITCQAPVDYDPDATAPLWEQCIEQWQPDPAVRGFLQAVIGTAATGDPVERVFVNLGGGANGKSRFYGAVERVLGHDYAVVPHKSLLVVQRHDQHDTVKARLFGARMAVASETEAGDRLDEAKLKEITGGDFLEARRMREDPWQFKPSHTLFLHTNNRPKVRGGDEGIWRRLCLIPWAVTIPPGERDSRLADKLADEGPGILNWIIEGVRRYLDAGLVDPDVVRDATADYRADEDHLGRFIADCCILDPTARVPAGALRTAYERWCDTMGEQSQSAKAIAPLLRAKGLDSAKIGHGNVVNWLGIGLAANVDDE